MKILYHVLYPPGLGDDRFTYEGYKEAFEDLGHSVLPLTEKMDLKSMLESFAPDIFIEEGGLLMDSLASKIGTLREFKEKGGRVILHGALSSELSSAIKRNNIIDAYFSEVDPRMEFPDFPPSVFKKMHWLAASRRIHGQAKPEARYECDILYIGAKLPKKQEAFNRLLLPLGNKYRVKIYGFDWDFFDRNILHPLAALERRTLSTGLVSRVRLMRQVPAEEEGNAYASAKISINFHEKQPGADFRTINARTFKIPASGGFELCDYVPQVRDFFAEDEVVMPRTEGEWFERIDYYLGNEQARKKVQERGTHRALNEHTFHHRVQHILRSLA